MTDDDLDDMGRAELRRAVRRRLAFDPNRGTALQVDELRRAVRLLDELDNPDMMD